MNCSSYKALSAHTRLLKMILSTPAATEVIECVDFNRRVTSRTKNHKKVEIFS